MNALDRMNKLLSQVNKHRDQWNAVIENTHLICLYLLSIQSDKGQLMQNEFETSDAAGNRESAPRKWIKAQAKSLLSTFRGMRQQPVSDGTKANAEGQTPLPSELSLGEWIGVQPNDLKRLSENPNLLDACVRLPLLCMLGTGSCDPATSLFGLSNGNTVSLLLCKPQLYGDISLTTGNSGDEPTGNQCSKLKIFDPAFKSSKRTQLTRDGVDENEIFASRYRTVSIHADEQSSRHQPLRCGFAPTPDNCLVVTRVSESLVFTREDVAEGDYILSLNNIKAEEMTLEVAKSEISKPGAALTLETFRYADIGSLLDVDDMFELTVGLCGCLRPDENRIPNMLMIMRSQAIATIVQGFVKRMRLTAHVGGKGSCTSRLENDAGLIMFSRENMDRFHQLWKFVHKVAYGGQDRDTESLDMTDRDIEITLLDWVLSYLKKCALLLSLLSNNPSSEWRKYSKAPANIVEGLIGETSNSQVDENYELSEIEYLWHKLGIPSLQSILDSTEMLRIVECWIKEWRRMNPFARPRQNILSSHLTSPSECCWIRASKGLVALPHRYDTLYRMILHEAKCPTTGGSIRKPALCLRCGVVLCASSSCCKRKGKGAVALHMKACCGGTGALLYPLTCRIMLLRGRHHEYIDAPYVDQHGETDPGLTRGRPLTLDVNQYERIREACISNSIASRVERLRGGTPADDF